MTIDEEKLYNLRECIRLGLVHSARMTALLIAHVALELYPELREEL